ncbi:unnamed protein product [Moneuplotes crassus]|uniref:Uncharacterized protein n=1 Tax=Euplotes crassus TaxID=5936 RepID=A0AAD2CVD3_EUPCR|nr:unnamed protein product [Moneuplotes crassus]
MYGDCDIHPNMKATQMRHHYSNGSERIFAPVVSSHSNALSPSLNFSRKVQNLCHRSEITPYVSYQYEEGFNPSSFAGSRNQNYPLGFNRNDSVPSLNYVSARLNSNRSQMVPLISSNSQRQERYIEDEAHRQGTRIQQSLPVIIPVRQMLLAQVPEVGTLDNIDISPPKLGFGSQPQSYINNNTKSHQLFKPLRKRVRSDNSTDSCESFCNKFSKTSERYHGSKRAKGRARDVRNRCSPEPRSKRNRFKKSSSPKNLVKRESYNMKRLDLGPSIESVRQQQELKSRLKAMGFHENAQKEDFSFVVPSLPITLIPSTDIPKFMEE